MSGLEAVQVVDAYTNEPIGDLAVQSRSSVNEMLHHVERLFCFLDNP